MSGRGWSLSDVVAEQVNRIRKQLGVSRDDVAERCAKLGYPDLTAAAMANIETGRRNSAGTRRRDLTIDEVVVLADALGVPPSLLMFPVERGEPIEVLPGRSVPARRAASWFAGEAVLPGSTETGSPLTLLRLHADLVRQFEASEREEFEWRRFAAPMGEPTERETLRESWRRQRIMDALRALRSEMRNRGVTPPELTGWLELLEHDMVVTSFEDGRMVKTYLSAEES